MVYIQNDHPRPAQIKHFLAKKKLDMYGTYVVTYTYE